ncbi:MAG TPA: hypothetical protein DDX09_04870, partial [Hyphomonas atlantica]|nr:hypothetical protein [Hyphomonas atlantica]
MAPNRKRRSYIRRFRVSSLFFIFLIIESQIVVVIVGVCIDFEVSVIIVIQQDVVIIIVIHAVFIESGRDFRWCIAVFVLIRRTFEDNFFLVATKFLGFFLVGFVVLIINVVIGAGGGILFVVIFIIILIIIFILIFIFIFIFIYICICICIYICICICI